MPVVPQVSSSRATSLSKNVSRRSGRYTFDRFRPIKVSVSRGFNDERVFKRLREKGNRALFKSRL